MFPIRDARGRVVSFGGRVLGDGQPKYLNGPETPVFAKRRALYGIDRARIAARAGAAVIVVEGYMDVIALHQAGFHGALAPLGTALTEDHLGELWKLSPAPVLCFDGDAAGARAASRALERAIPHLAPDRSLRIVRLPGGEDPDSLMRKPDSAPDCARSWKAWRARSAIPPWPGKCVQHCSRSISRRFVSASPGARGGPIRAPRVRLSPRGRPIPPAYKSCSAC
jgi:DNA primase